MLQQATPNRLHLLPATLSRLQLPPACVFAFPLAAACRTPAGLSNSGLIVGRNGGRQRQVHALILDE